MTNKRYLKIALLLLAFFAGPRDALSTRKWMKSGLSIKVGSDLEAELLVLERCLAELAQLEGKFGETLIRFDPQLHEVLCEKKFKGGHKVLHEIVDKIDLTLLPILKVMGMGNKEELTHCRLRKKYLEDRDLYGFHFRIPKIGNLGGSYFNTVEYIRDKVFLSKNLPETSMGLKNLLANESLPDRGAYVEIARDSAEFEFVLFKLKLNCNEYEIMRGPDGTNYMNDFDQCHEWRDSVDGDFVEKWLNYAQVEDRYAHEQDGIHERISGLNLGEVFLKRLISLLRLDLSQGQDRQTQNVLDILLKARPDLR